MTITEMVEKHGLPVKVRRLGLFSLKPFTIRTKRGDGWYVEYDDVRGTYFLFDNPKLDDYEKVE